MNQQTKVELLQNDASVTPKESTWELARSQHLRFRIYKFIASSPMIDEHAELYSIGCICFRPIFPPPKAAQISPETLALNRTNKRMLSKLKPGSKINFWTASSITRLVVGPCGSTLVLVEVHINDVNVKCKSQSPSSSCSVAASKHGVHRISKAPQTSLYHWRCANYHRKSCCP